MIRASEHVVWRVGKCIIGGQLRRRGQIARKNARDHTHTCLEYMSVYIYGQFRYIASFWCSKNFLVGYSSLLFFLLRSCDNILAILVVYIKSLLVK